MISDLIRAVTRVKLGPSIWGSFELFANPVLNVLVAPILIGAYGMQGYGSWIFIFSTAAIGIIGGLGVPGVANWLVAKSVIDAKGETLKVVGAQILFLTLISTLLGIAVISASFYAARFLELRIIVPRVDFSSGLIMATALYAAQQIDGVLSGMLRGFDRFRELAIVEVLSKAFSFISISAAASQGLEIIQCFIVFLLISFAAAFFKILLTLFFINKYYQFSEKNSKLSLLEIFKNSKWFWLQAVSSFVFSSFDRIIVGAIVSPVALAAYAIATQLGGVILLLFSGFFQRLITATKRLSAVENNSERLRVFNKLFLLNICLSCLSVVAVWLFVDIVVIAWLGDKGHDILMQPISYIMFPFLLLSGTVAAHYILIGLDSFRQVGLLNFVGGIILVVLMIPLVSKFELIGAAAARTIYAVGFYFEWHLLYKLSKSSRYLQ